MRIIAALCFIMPMITFWFFLDRKQLAGPINIWSLLYFFKISIPGLFYCSINSLDSINNSYLRSSLEDNSVFIQYSVLQMISYYLVIFGIGLKSNDNKAIIYQNPKYCSIESTLDYDSSPPIGYKVWGILFTVIGMMGFISLMRNIGGVYFFLTNLQYRSSLIRDYDIQSWLISLLHYGPLLFVYSLKGTKKQISVTLIVFLMICGLMTGLGGRKDLVMILIQTLFIYHYAVRPLKIHEFLKPKYIITAILTFMFFVIYVQLRQEGALLEFVNNPQSFLVSESAGIVETIRGESYIPYYTAIIKHFRDHRYWFGGSFGGLITAIIPSSLYYDKPPVDDGMYLYSICRGHDVVPVMPAHDLDGSSFPLETFGSMYANFGTVGVFIGMILLGIIIGIVYRKMVNNNYNLFYIILYTHIIINFQLSTLRIFQLLISVAVVWFVVWFSQNIHFNIGSKKQIE